MEPILARLLALGKKALSPEYQYAGELIPRKAIEHRNEEIEKLEASHQLRMRADDRALRKWRAAHPNKVMYLPDHADLCVFLMTELDKVSPNPDQLTLETVLKDIRTKINQVLPTNPEADEIVEKRIAEQSKPGKSKPILRFDPIKDDGLKYSIEIWTQIVKAEIDEWLVMWGGKNANNYTREEHTFWEWLNHFSRYMSW